MILDRPHSNISTTTRVSMDEAKLVHRSLRRGAGLLKYAQDEWVNKLLESPAPMSDCDPRVHTAYLNQATAEAQEGWCGVGVLAGISFYVMFVCFLI